MHRDDDIIVQMRTRRKGIRFNFKRYESCLFVCTSLTSLYSNGDQSILAHGDSPASVGVPGLSSTIGAECRAVTKRVSLRLLRRHTFRSLRCSGYQPESSICDTQTIVLTLLQSTLSFLTL